MTQPAHGDHAPVSMVSGPDLTDDPTLGPLTLPAWFLTLTERHATREVLAMCTDTGTPIRWTYAELRQQAFALARALIAAGVGKGERVGILMTNTPSLLASVFGVSLAGGVPAMLSTFCTRDELAYLLNSSGCAVLLFQREVLGKDFAALLADIEPAIAGAGSSRLLSTRLPFLRRLVATSGIGNGGALQSWEEFIAQGADTSDAGILARCAATAPADPGMLFFSSGSTNKPKGILHSHRGTCIQLWRMQSQQGLPDGVRSWTANGFFWSGNFAMVVGATLSAGGSLVLQPTFNPEEALGIIATLRASFLFAWPHQWTQLVAAKNWSAVDLSSVRQVDPECPVARHPTISTDWIEPRYCYGNTETFTLTTGLPAGTTAAASRGSHGRPFPGNTVKIVDPVDGRLLPLGERGEIAVKGPTLMLGYLGTPLDETLDDEGFFRTGDGGWLDDAGLLHWEGRLNDIIKTGGANVSPLEVDDVLRGCPGVKLCQTVGVPHDTLGELVVSCVVREDTSDLSENALRDYARERLASYKVPRRVLFFEADAIALTGTAKIKTAELRERAARLLKE